MKTETETEMKTEMKTENKSEITCRWCTLDEVYDVVYDDDIIESMNHLGPIEDYYDIIRKGEFLGMFMRGRLVAVFYIIKTFNFTEFHTLIKKRYRVHILKFYDKMYLELITLKKPLITRLLPEQLYMFNRILDLYCFEHVATVNGLLCYSDFKSVIID